MEDKGKKSFLDEYQHIHELRKLWSGAIMDWIRVGIPVGGALFGFFSFLGTYHFSTWQYSWLLPILGWLIFVIPTILWRVVAHHIDLQIVRMYPQMLKLERELGWVTHATYYYSNLSQKGRESLEDKLKRIGLKIQNGWLNHRSYRQYEQECKGRREPISLLLDVCDELGHQSVTSRGHKPQDWAVGFVGLTSLFLAFLLAWNLSTQLCCALCASVIAMLLAAGFACLLAWKLK